MSRKTRRSARFLFTYHVAMMKAVLTLQMPADDWRSGRILAACSDLEVIRSFCNTLLALRIEEADRLDDPFERELARLEIEQLQARIAFALDIEDLDR